MRSDRKPVRCVLAAVLLALALYLLALGPASAWVARTITQGPISAATAANYDARLAAFDRFYAPVLYSRYWLRWHGLSVVDGLFSYYEGFFYAGQQLPDGRRAFTTLCFENQLSSRESATDYARKLCAGVGETLSTSSEAFFLPKTSRLLVILAPVDDTDIISLGIDGAIDESPNGFAELRF